MKHVVNILPEESYPQDKISGVFSADYEGRHRRRIVLMLQSGEGVLLDLKQARLLREGEALALDDGRLIRVEAQPEALVKVTAHNPHHLLQLAWHLGNRHLPAMIEPECILIRQDRVIEDMVIGLGGHTHRIEAPFNPENGAYGGQQGDNHSHDHHHSSHHGHDHGDRG